MTGIAAALIATGMEISEAATVAARANRLAGYYVKPTIISHVTNDMTIAQEEIFGPVLSIIGYSPEG